MRSSSFRVCDGVIEKEVVVRDGRDGFTIGRLSPLPLIPMSVQRLYELPVEILEKTFLHLPGQDTVRLESVSGFVSGGSMGCGSNFASARSRSANTSGILFAIRPPFSIKGTSSPLAWWTIPTFLAILPCINKHTRSISITGPLRLGRRGVFTRCLDTHLLHCVDLRLSVGMFSHFMNA